jgi:hypothetical protein
MRTGTGIEAEAENSERNDEKDARNGTEVRVNMRYSTRNDTKKVIEFES